MKIEKNLNCFEAEVISSDISKYSSTSVSGGGASITSTGNYVQAQVNPVISHVTHHSDQDLWVKDVETGNEINLNFSTFNISVRPGHKLVLLTDKLSNNIFERIVNLSTGDRANCNGNFNKSILSGIGQEFILLIMIILISVIPYANICLMVVLVMSIFMPTMRFFPNDGGDNSYFERLKDCAFLMLPSISLYFSLINMSYYPFILASIILIAYVFRKRVLTQYFVLKRSREIDDFLNEFMLTRGHKF